MPFKPLSFLVLCLSFLLAPVFGGIALSAQVQKGQIRSDVRTKLLESKCVDYYKRPVLHVRNDKIGDVAFSNMMRLQGVNMGPMTIVNINRLSKLSRASQLFFIAHECGHHVLGHLYFRSPGQSVEQEADCYAIRTLIRGGFFTLRDVETVQSDLRKYARASQYHATGPERASALPKCME